MESGFLDNFNSKKVKYYFQFTNLRDFHFFQLYTLFDQFAITGIFRNIYLEKYFINWINLFEKLKIFYILDELFKMKQTSALYYY